MLSQGVKGVRGNGIVRGQGEKELSNQMHAIGGPAAKNAAAGSELEKFFARAWFHAGVLQERLDSSVGPKAKACANSKNWHCQPVLRMLPLALTLWHWYWRVQTGLVRILQQRDGLSLLTSSHSLCSGPMCLPPTFSARTPSKSYDEDAGPGVHRIQDQGQSQANHIGWSPCTQRVQIRLQRGPRPFELQQVKPSGRQASPTSCPIPNYWSTCYCLGEASLSLDSKLKSPGRL